MPSASVRSAATTAAIAYAVQAVILVVLLIVTAARTPLPVVATFASHTRTVVAQIAAVDLGWALVAVLAGGAATHVLVATRAGQPATRGRARTWRRPRLLLAAGWSQGSAILVFLIAQLNGIAEVTSLVPLYAITATAVALLGIDRERTATTWARPGAWAAAGGIVPWGVIAFAQIGSGIAVGEVTIGVRVVTLLALALAVLGWITGWRRPASPRIPDLVAMTVGLSVVVWAMAVFTVLTA